MIAADNLVDRIDQSDSKEVRPHAVYGSTGEVWIIGLGDPLGERAARVGPFSPLRLFPVQEPGLGRARSIWNRNLTLGRVFAACDHDLAGSLSLHSGKKRGETPELVAFPVCEWMVVALGTFQFHSEKNARCGGGQVLGHQVLGKVKGIRRRPFVTAIWKPL